MILRFKAVLVAFGLMTAVAACDAGPRGTAAPEPAAAVDAVDPAAGAGPSQGPAADADQTSVQRNLQRLRDLDVIEVGGLLPGDAALAKLATLAEVASDAALRDIDAAMCAPAAIDANLAALAGLEIVEVHGLVQAEPAMNPMCYNLPCPEDVAAAEALTCTRAGQLANIAAAAAGAFDAPAPELPPRAEPDLTAAVGAALAAVDANLAKLAALEIVAVGDLVVALPAGSMNCYGPCPEDAEAIAAARGAAALRLDALTTAAEAAVGLPNDPAACEPAAIEASLAALAALEIVEVHGMVVAEPANNPMCYSLPCPEDVAAAEALNCQRAGDLANIVAQAQDL
jgi:hypothetical protein